MAPQIHSPDRAARGEYSRFEHKLRQRWCALRDEEVTRDVQEIRAVC